MRPSYPYYENIYTDKISTNVCTCHDNIDAYKHLKRSRMLKIWNDNFISFQWIMIEKFSWNIPLIDVRIIAIFKKNHHEICPLMDVRIIAIPSITALPSNPHKQKISAYRQY